MKNVKIQGLNRNCGYDLSMFWFPLYFQARR